MHHQISDVDIVMQEMEDSYAQWQEEERKHAHIMSVYRILDTLGDSEPDQNERKYQSLRMKHSPAYFSGHMAYRGERLNPLRQLDMKQYECAVRMLGVVGLLGVCM